MFKKKIRIAPSLLSADFSRLGAEVEAVTEAGADMIHFDVMDGHFVPNITFGPMVLKAIRSLSRLPFDTHLMISNPEKYWRAFSDAGSDVIGLHIESGVDHMSIIEDIHREDKKICMVLNPLTPAEAISPFMESVDQVLVMTVNPGFGGQEFMSGVVPKIEQLRLMREKAGRYFDIEVDGGINSKTAEIVKKAGADIIVAGSFIFGSPDYRGRIDSLR